VLKEAFRVLTPVAALPYSTSGVMTNVPAQIKKTWSFSLGCVDGALSDSSTWRNAKPGFYNIEPKGIYTQ
jgi:hypothetical protein